MQHCVPTCLQCWYMVSTSPWPRYTGHTCCGPTPCPASPGPGTCCPGPRPGPAQPTWPDQILFPPQYNIFC